MPVCLMQLRHESEYKSDVKEREVTETLRIIVKCLVN